MNSATQLRKQLNQKFPKQFELDIGANGFVLLKVISEQFEDKSRVERLAKVEPLIQTAELMSGIIDLYTPDEANEQDVSFQQVDDFFPSSWQDAMRMLASGKTTPIKKPEHPIKRVVFYSYKGGVGRTTALIQTAFQLTRAGKRVVMVDMDVEAPALQALLPPSDKSLDAGLIDYLWERQTCFFDNSHQPKVHLNGEGDGIVYSVKDTHSKRPLFVVPAGRIGERYIQRLSALTAAQLFAHDNDPWYQFEQELWEQFQPDIMLIDARTGLNEWGGLSLLRLADEAFIALYPSEQNAEGVCFIQKMLKELSGVQAKLILSPIPEGIVGHQLVENIKPSLGLNRGQKESEESPFIQIPYNPNIAGNSGFPVESALPYYAPIANSLLEISGVEKAEAAITQVNRLSLIKSLSFPERDAASILDADFDAIFQKTADFERCLDDAVWVIRGRKGTGKSTLYTLFTQHRENAEKRSHGRLNKIFILSAHGESDEFRPTADVFEKIQKKLSEANTDWLSFWRAYAVVCLYRSCPEFINILKAKLKSLSSRLKYSFDKNEHTFWSLKHTNKITELAIDSRLSEYCRDALSYFNKFLKLKSQKVWLLYDDLDQDIKENSPWQQEALGGLMRLVYDTNNQSLYHIRFKVFLREDIWSNLVFTNKSHFGEARTLLLQWGKTDLFRLAYRLAIGGSTDFKILSNRISPLTENELDDADEETLRQALAPLWGLSSQKSKNTYVAQWVYTRLTDSSDNTYPRSLTILLKQARELELKSRQGKIAPSNHLLRWNALTGGLEAASEERCNAIKNEYPEFGEFFNQVNELKSLFYEKDLQELWKKTIPQQSKTSFDRFVKRLQEIGFLVSKKYSKYDYAIANLYVYGFGVKRKQGQRK